MQIDTRHIRRCAKRSGAQKGYLFVDTQNKRLGHAEMNVIPEPARKEPIFKKKPLVYIHPEYIARLSDKDIEQLFLRLIQDA